VPGATDDATGDALAWIADPVAAAAALGKDVAASVFGADPKEKAVGPAAAKKLRADESGAIAWAAANVTAHFTVKGADVALRYRVLAIAAKQADGAWKLVSLHYSLPAA
jgi:ketosteroid isomerase-like protein